MDEQKDTVVATETITDEEKKMIADLAARRQLSFAQAQAAIAKNQTVDLEHKNLVLQLFMKYKLNPETDSIDEKGQLVRGEVK